MKAKKPSRFVWQPGDLKEEPALVQRDSSARSAKTVRAHGTKKPAAKQGKKK